MNFFNETRFTFESFALAEDTFGVVSFTGSEGLSQLYSFDINLISDNPNLDMQAILQDRAVFRIHRSDKSVVRFNGLVVEFDLIRAVGDCYLYRALLVPALWRLTLTHHNQVFLDKTPKEILSDVLEDGRITSLDYEFRLQESYFTWEYACQYGESHYAFFSRWLERNGMYYFFEQEQGREKLIITDSRMSHNPAPLGAELLYSPVSGLEDFHLEEVAQSFICRRRNVPHTIELRDYDYRHPSLDVAGRAEVSKDGFGEMYYYGDHFRTPEGGDKLATLRSEELLCRAEQFHGESSVPYISPGFRFLLDNHFRADMNADYLTISMEHEGNQAAFLIAGLRELLSADETKSLYRNSFTAIQDQVQFRAERTTPQPRIHGSINARIDGSGSGDYAELDEHGRYKVVLPFDRADRSGGKASAWVRMMQPSAGPGMGMHFPLHKSTEVLLTFIDGNPDRPIIAGAMSNTEHPSVINSTNQTKAGFRTAGGSSFHTEDSKGHEHFVMKAGDGKCTMRFGAGSGSAWVVSAPMAATGGAGCSSVASAFHSHMWNVNRIGIGVGLKGWGIAGGVISALLGSLKLYEKGLETKIKVLTHRADEKKEEAEELEEEAKKHEKLARQKDKEAEKKDQEAAEEEKKAVEKNAVAEQYETEANHFFYNMKEKLELKETKIVGIQHLDKNIEQYNQEDKDADGLKRKRDVLEAEVKQLEKDADRLDSKVKETKKKADGIRGKNDKEEYVNEDGKIIDNPMKDTMAYYKAEADKKKKEADGIRGKNDKEEYVNEDGKAIINGKYYGPRKGTMAYYKNEAGKLKKESVRIIGKNAEGDYVDEKGDPLLLTEDGKKKEPMAETVAAYKKDAEHAEEHGWDYCPSVDTVEIIDGALELCEAVYLALSLMPGQRPGVHIDVHGGTVLTGSSHIHIGKGNDVKIEAHKGDVKLEAHKGNVTLDAHKAVKLASGTATCSLKHNDNIELVVGTAAKTIKLLAGTARVAEVPAKGAICTLTHNGDIDLEVTVEDKSITLTAGDSKYTMKKNGDIELTVGTATKSIKLTAGTTKCTLTNNGAAELAAGTTKCTLKKDGAAKLESATSVELACGDGG